MNIFLSLYYTILYQPLFNALILLYLYLPVRDFGIAVIVLTILLRLVLYPSMNKSIKAQKVMAELQPKLQEIQRKYKDNRERQTKEMLELYRREKINPLSGFLPLLIQLPIFIALYQIFIKGFQNSQMSYLYSFVPDPNLITPMFLGLINLSNPNIILALFAGIAQFFQTKMMTKKTKKTKSGSQFAEMFQKQMLYFFPVFTVLILWKLPAVVGLYWLTTALFSILQQHLVLKKEYAK